MTEEKKEKKEKKKKDFYSSSIRLGLYYMGTFRIKEQLANRVFLDRVGGSGEGCHTGVKHYHHQHMIYASL